MPSLVEKSNSVSSDTFATALELDFFASAPEIPEYRLKELSVKLAENRDFEIICYDEYEFECSDC
jgi:hypothetical protein